MPIVAQNKEAISFDRARPSLDFSEVDSYDYARVEYMLTMSSRRSVIKKKITLKYLALQRMLQRCL